MFLRPRNKTMHLLQRTNLWMQVSTFLPARIFNPRRTVRPGEGNRWERGWVFPLFRPRIALLSWRARRFCNCFPKWKLEKARSRTSHRRRTSGTALRDSPGLDRNRGVKGGSVTLHFIVTVTQYHRPLPTRFLELYGLHRESLELTPRGTRAF